jgi:hypothetical protein
MTTIRSTRLGVLLFIPLLAGLGSTGAQAYDPRVTTRQSDLMGGRSPRVVRDHRYPGGVPAGGVTVTDTPRDPIARDHRAEPVVRDHRTSGPFVPDNWKPGPIVRDHRTSGPFVPDDWKPGPIVRDHRTPGPIVRDHRTPGPIVRDHRTSGPIVPDGWTPGPIVRDHRRPGSIVRDYRGQNGAPQGGVIVTSSTRQRGSTPCIRNILGGPCIGLGGQ